MSVSETVMTSRDHFTVAGVQNSPPNVPNTTPVAQNMHLGYSGDSTAVFTPISTSPPPYTPAEVSAGAGAVLSQNLNINSSETMKRKRGRPRKYGPDGSMALGLNSPSVAPAAAGSLSPQEPVTSPAAQPLSTGPASPISLKKARGRPPGSSKKQQMDNSFGATGFGFTPHIITVKTGEDVASKIMSFSQNGPRAVCILSASGAISNVTLRQAATSGGTATYEGRFDILSLSGSFLLSEIGGQRSRTGGLSVSLAGSDGRIFGGCVAGVLTAASPVQVIVGSFIADGRKESKSANHFDASPAPLNANPGAMMGGSSSPSRGTHSESSGGPGSPLNQSAPVCTNNNLQGMSSMPWK
ncbi:PREDICTED: AT-hook motif nuclear-localized protein 10-like [Nicotiana attenuata]|uniref:AT-hook motif nuclear-localized protein n=1 Tax=Nicotiana attenuata TaxID=49451 RepID=A0A1J6IKU0_NICAT|nr:PREDICTED: AT-hook motif nuclear-localized protein 10-like [Nicotiana attenuata]XP_019223872.1 PREDICTED: AT-hook motif nuclear-localized protein 10-like [Nicotiana attenuata]XP_019223879.1 PREDICTED: AT-hook motif nuclear-localized protein 10-like [Nicotiana attenuata]XP_019223885.1 PREDICTED: AT-hook motif nuclear-localized protein 10-like [Nicotiana attenuata]OIT05749.1 at-hook motif nuclear-localized protein 10 [Nicotiana attenuata]